MVTPQAYTVRQALDTDAQRINDFITATASVQPSVNPTTIEKVAAKIAKANEPGAGRYYVCIKDGQVMGCDIFCDTASCIIEDKDRAALLGVKVGTVIECDYVPMLIIKSGLGHKTYNRVAALLTLKAKDIQAEGKLHEFLWVRGALDCAGAGYIRSLEADEKPHGIKDGDWVVRWKHAFEIAEQMVR